MLEQPAPAESAPFYVGYLPLPHALGRFLRIVVPCTLWILCIVSFLWARSQHDPGTGAWETGRPVRLHGHLIARPYPVLFTDPSPEAPSRAVLLVEGGKHGAQSRAAALDGRHITVSGWRIHREGREILELEPAPEAIREDAGRDSPSSTAPQALFVGSVRLRGEIVDSKCFLGAMKPGEGKTHKECAILCIRGGIPPMFITRAGDSTDYYLLANAEGGPLDSEAHQYIADPVEVTGEVVRLGPINILRIRSPDIRRQ